jgi:hypothetical protein
VRTDASVRHVFTRMVSFLDDARDRLLKLVSATLPLLLLCLSKLHEDGFGVPVKAPD